MKITGTGPVRTAPARRKDPAARAGEGAFAAELASAGRPAPSVAARPVETLDALLSVQEVPDATDRARRAARHAEDLLDRLDELRHALLVGTLPRNKLDQLARLVRTRREAVADPNLAAVLDEIELRCRVELAKLEPAEG
jgi:hypothetical protein